MILNNPVVKYIRTKKSFIILKCPFNAGHEIYSDKKVFYYSCVVGNAHRMGVSCEIYSDKKVFYYSGPVPVPVPDPVSGPVPDPSEVPI
jgi:hypothetical protein